MTFGGLMPWRSPVLMTALAAPALTLLVAEPAESQNVWGGPVVTPSQVSGALNDPDVVILHFGNEERFAQAHIPGARFARGQDFETPPPGAPGAPEDALTTELPDPGHLQAVLRDLGVEDDSRIVIYWDDAREPHLTRVLFTLDWAGLGDRSAAMLGGLALWEEFGGEVATTEPPAPSPGQVTVRPRSDLTVSADEIEVLARTPGVAVIDARAAAFYDGVREDPRGKAGHIPGAGNLPHRNLFQDDQTYLPLDEVRALLEDAGVSPGDRVVAYCHIGLFGTTVVLAARLLGHDAALFDGSWEEWARTDRPVAVPQVD